MSTNTQELARAFAAVVGQNIKNKFTAIAQSSMASNEANATVLKSILAWLTTAIDETASGAASLNVPIAGASSNHAQPNGFGGGGNALSSFVANTGPQAQQGFAPQQQQFGGQQQQFGAPQQPQAAAPKDAKLSLAECGLARVPSHMQLPNGAKCGVAHTSNACPGMTLYCDKAATVQGSCGSYTCTGHKKRETADTKGKGGKKSGSAAVTSAQQIVGLQSQTFMPTGFGQNPAAVGQMTGLMQQQPHAPFAGFGQQPANPALSNQLQSSMQHQVGAIPQSNPVAAGGGFNFNTVLQQPATNAVAINQAFGGIPSTPQAPFGGNTQAQFGGQQVAFGAPQQGFGQFAPPQQQQAPIGFGQFGQAPVNIQPQASMTGFAQSEDGGSSDDESNDSDSDEPMPIPVSNPADIAAVNVAAGIPQPMVSFGQAAAPNPLQAAVAIQQQQSPVAAPEPINPLIAMTVSALAK